MWLPAIWIHDTLLYRNLTIAVTHSTTLETWMAHVGKDKALAGSAKISRADAGSHDAANKVMEAITQVAGSKEVRLDPELLLVLHDGSTSMTRRTAFLLMHGHALMAVLRCEPFGPMLLAETLWHI